MRRAAVLLILAVAVVTGFLAYQWRPQSASLDRPDLHARPILNIDLKTNTPVPVSSMLELVDSSETEIEPGAHKLNDNSLWIAFDIPAARQIEWWLEIEFNQDLKNTREPEVMALAGELSGVTVESTEPQGSTLTVRGTARGPLTGATYFKNTIERPGSNGFSLETYKSIVIISFDTGDTPPVINKNGQITITAPDFIMEDGDPQDEWLPPSEHNWVVGTQTSTSVIRLLGPAPTEKNAGEGMWIAWDSQTSEDPFAFTGELDATNAEREARLFWGGIAAGVSAAAFLMILGVPLGSQGTNRSATERR